MSKQAAAGLYQAVATAVSAIDKITKILASSKTKKDNIVLKGATGTGKTFTLAKIIEHLNEVEGFPRQVSEYQILYTHEL